MRYSSTVQKGSEFEIDVARIYEAFGYSVEVDSRIDGNQVDLVCTLKVRGAPTIKLFIECKNYRNKVSVTETNKFINTFNSFSGQSGFSGGVLISKSGLTREAKNALNGHKQCKAIKYSDLMNALLDVEASLRAFIAEFETKDIHLFYLPLRCKSESELEDDLETVISGWRESTKQLLVILGGFGTGKTTTLMKLKHQLAKDFVSGKNQLIPLFISLRDFESFGSTDLFFEEKLKEEMGIEISYKKFINLLKEGRFLLLLDGFDEMGQRIDSKVRFENFENLIPVISASPKTILTCRPAYFISDDELFSIVKHYSNDFTPAHHEPNFSEKLSGYGDFIKQARHWSSSDEKFSISGTDSVTILPFTKEDVVQYVTNYVSCKRTQLGHIKSAKDILKRIRQTYDLQDLSRRPILLNLIVETLPLIPKMKEASPSIIYNEYTIAWMCHDYGKGRVRKLIRLEEKEQFMNQLAWQMYDSNSLKFHYKELLPHLSDFFKQSGILEEFIASDIQACSFLERDALGFFRFSHKSFMEFFCGKYLYSALLEDNLNDFIGQSLSDEICFFLGDLIHDSGELPKIFEKHILNTFRSRYKRMNLENNLLRILSKTRLKIWNLKIIDRSFKNIGFFRNTLFSLSMSHVELSKIYFKECDLKTVSFESVSFVECKITESKLTHIDILNNEKEKYDKRLARISMSESNPNVPDKMDLRYLKDKIADLKSGFVESPLIIENSKLKVVKVSNFYKVTFRSCVIDELTIPTNDNFIRILRSVIKYSYIGGKIHIGNSIINKSVITHNIDSYLDKPNSKNGYKKQIKHILRLWRSKKDQYDPCINSIFNNCLFLWYDFSTWNFKNNKFHNCIFIGCRVFDDEQLKKLLSNSTNCSFFIISISHIQRSKKNKSNYSPRIPVYKDIIRDVLSATLDENDTQIGTLKLLKNPKYSDFPREYVTADVLCALGITDFYSLEKKINE